MSELLLGKAATYESQYNAGLLFPIPRQQNRNDLNLTPQNLPFSGEDIWHAYEISWLNTKGKPQVAIGRFAFPCTSPNLVESKSFKLYLNSFNHSQFESWDQVIAILQKDLSACAGEKIGVELFNLRNFSRRAYRPILGICIDDLDVDITEYQVNPQLLAVKNELVSETLYSNLLKSNCLVTGQPDWGAVQIQYKGPQIERESLLKYIISFRNHNEFHEQCVERVFMDIQQHCRPTSLTITACYTRRGGLDINPFRTSTPLMHSPKHYCPRQ